QLLQEAGRPYHMHIHELQLSGQWQALSRCSGQPRLAVDCEWHGRAATTDGVEVSRTVGWFTAIYPVLLEAEARWGVGERLKRLKEQARQAGRQALSYGVLRYLSKDEEVRRSLSGGARPQVLFNYFGQLDEVVEAERMAEAAESVGASRNGGGERHHELEVNSSVIGGQLAVHLSYSGRRYERASVERLGHSYVEGLEEVIGHCLSGEAGGRTASDYELSGLSQGELERVERGRGEIEDIYAVTPMQAGMLFHTLYA